MICVFQLILMIIYHSLLVDNVKCKKVKKEEEVHEFKTLQIKGSTAVDPECLLKDDLHVFEKDGTGYSATMNLSNMKGGANNNKFYIVQAL